MAGSVPLGEACRRLFARYPLAIENERYGDSQDSMVLVLRDGDDPKFFVLQRHHGESRPSYLLKPWQEQDGVHVTADATDPVPREFLDAITSGVPFPRHGSLFGWQESGTVTALVAFYARYMPRSPEPRWSVLPLAEAPESRWPPFTSERHFGPWFWEDFRAGDVVAVEDLISRTPGAAFWAHTEATLGSGCCVVSRQIMDPSGYVVPRGRFVFHEILSAGKPLPPLEELLARPDTTDLTPRFPQSA